MGSVKKDLKKDLDCYRAARGHTCLLDVPQLTYLMIDGHGDPNTEQAFAEAIETLYPVAYTVKFASKNDLGRDYVVPPLEGQSVQTLHVGSFDDEAETLRQLHEEFIPDLGLRPAGRHHEIYLSDFRRVAPERQRTILRQPVAPS